MRHPVNLPRAAIKALNAATKSQNPQWPCEFSASAIDLNGDSIDDYIVTSTGGDCMGADNVPFWILWHDRDTYAVLLYERGSTLEVLKTRTNGFYNIRTSWDVAAQGTTELYTFRKGAYRQTRRWYRHRS